MPVSDKKKRNLIYLVGMPGVGKSTIGKKLKKHFEFEFIDLDREIENTTKHSISSIFAKYGEETFRDIEAKVLRSVSNQSVIIATGGGTPIYQDNMHFMLQNGVVTYLTLPIEMLVGRVNQSRTKRPLFEGKTDAELQSFISELYQRRKHVYENAQIHFSTKSVTTGDLLSLTEKIRSYLKS